MKFYTGAVLSKWDKRNYKWSEIGHGSAPFDWSKTLKIEVESLKNQQSSSSCGGQAMSYYGEVLNKVFDGKAEERSAKFIYSQTFVPGGGTAITDLTKLVTDAGWGLESLTPSYFQNNVTEEFMTRRSDISQEAFKYALKDRALAYTWVSNTNIDTIAQAIQANNGAIVGIQGANNGTWLTKFPNCSTKKEWAHWLFCVGAEKIGGKKYIIVKNSWGNIGENGYQWLSEEFFTTGKCFACVTLVYNPIKPPEEKHIFCIDMNYGDTNNEVKWLQDVLKKDGVFPANVPSSGAYGDVTKNAVLAFLYKYKITNPFSIWWNGGKYVGSLTRTKLNQIQ